MRKLAAPVVAVLLLAACGGQESGTAAEPLEGDANTPAVESAPDAAALAVKGCLDLVAQGRFADAVQACEAAVEAAPDSTAARSALDRARTAATAGESY